jgi:hypothetical protein
MANAPNLRLNVQKLAAQMMIASENYVEPKHTAMTKANAFNHLTSARSIVKVMQIVTNQLVLPASIVSMVDV